MTIMTDDQIDAIRRVLGDVEATAVAAHEIGGGRVWVTMWLDDDTIVFHGTISSTGSVYATALDQPSGLLGVA